MQRGRAVKGGSEVGHRNRSLPTAVFRVVRARSAWGEELEKVSRPLLAACRRATLRVQGAPGRVSDRRGGGVRHGIGHGRRGFRTWDAICRRLLGRSRGLRRDVAWRTEARFRVAALRSGTGRPLPCRSRSICSRGRWRRGGSPCGTATVLRSTSVGRRRTAVDGHQREGRASRAARRGGRGGKAGEGAGPAARVHGARRPAGPSRRRGHTGPEVDKREMRRAHRGRRAHPGGCRTRSFMPRARAGSQRRPPKGNAPLSAGKPLRCSLRLFDSGRRPELGRP